MTCFSSDVTPIHVGRRTLAAVAHMASDMTCVTTDPLHAVVWMNLEASAGTSDVAPITSSSTKNLLEYDVNGIKEKDL